MFDWITVVSLITFGLLLLVVEIIFVPGTTLVGVLGFGLLIVGIGISFRSFGEQTGWITLGVTLLASGAVLYYSFSSDAWKKFSLKTSSQGKVNEGQLEEFEVGMEGITVSNLRPVGKAELKDKLMEVRTQGDFLDRGRRIRIIQITSNQIIVEPIN